MLNIAKVNKNSNGWYCIVNDTYEYLHADGIIRNDVRDSDGDFTGYFLTEASLVEAILKYFKVNGNG